MAEVWEARHEVLGVSVALKFLLRQTPLQRQRLIREARVQASFDHPNILAVRDIISIEDEPVLVLPLVRGPSLRRYLKDNELTLEIATELFRDICAGVAHAHDKGAIHRDLKPENVLLGEHRGRIHAFVSDFGLVKSLRTTQTSGGAVLGTLGYVAPEQLMNPNEADERADLFSLGVLLYEMCTGGRLFDFTTIGTLLRAYRTPPSLEAMPEPQRSICARLIAFDPAARFPSCAAILDALPPAEATAAPLLLATPFGRSIQEYHLPPVDMIQQDELSEAASEWNPDDLPLAPTFESWAFDLDPASLDGGLHGLPLETDQFIGRDEDCKRLHDQLANSRLVTVVGSGGTGKTRLVVHYARTDHGHGSVWFCDLVDSRSANSILDTIAQTLGLAYDGGTPDTERIAYALRSHGSCLVILDNFEHLVPFAALTVAPLLEKAPDARFLVTSRSLLDLAGERLFPLGPLPRASARELFASRSRLRQPDFAITPSNADAVEELIDLLDGLPLAVELAAGRIRALSPQQMVERMAQRFRLLRPAGRQLDSGRSKALRATIDWSWELLTPLERSAFRQCSVFEGGFSLDAAEHVIDLGDFDDNPWVLDAIQSLVDKSLIRPLPDNALGEPRFGMLLSLQQYAAEQLASDPEAERACVERHALYFMEFGALCALDALSVAGGEERLRALSPELDNLEAAASRSVGIPAAHAALAAYEVLHLRGYRGPHQLLERALSGLPADAPADLECALRVRLARTHLAAGAHEAVRREVLLVRERAPVDAHEIRTDATLCLGQSLHTLGDVPRARAELEGALARAQNHRIPAAQTRVELVLGDHLLKTGASAEAEQHVERALAWSRTVGDQRSTARAMFLLGCVCRHQTELDEAMSLFGQSYALFDALDARAASADVLCQLGMIDEDRGEPDRARVRYTTALRILEELGDRTAVAVLLARLGGLERQRGQLERAMQHFSRSLAIHRALGSVHGRAVVLASIGLLNLDRQYYEDAERDLTESLTIHRQVGHRFDENQTLEYLALLYEEWGDLERAQEHLETARRGFQDYQTCDKEAQTVARLARVAFAQGHDAACTQALTQLAPLLEQVENASTLGRIEEDLCVLHLRRGNLDAARAALDSADHHFANESIQLRLYAACTRIRLEHEARDASALDQAARRLDELAAAMDLSVSERLMRTVEEARARVGQSR